MRWADFWVGTIDDARAPQAALYRWELARRQTPRRAVQKVADGITNSNGLGFSPDGGTLYWADTQAHQVFALALDLSDGSLSGRRVFHAFAPRAAGQAIEAYGGRPDGAAMDAEGGYWVAMFEGQRLVRLGPDGALSAELRLPVRCPTMPCFGGARPAHALHHHGARQAAGRGTGGPAVGGLRLAGAGVGAGGCRPTWCGCSWSTASALTRAQRAARTDSRRVWPMASTSNASSATP